MTFENLWTVWQRHPWCRALLVPALLLALAPLAGAQQVEAQLSSNVASVGMPVQLTLRVTGSARAQLPREIAADGLRIVLRSQSTEFRMLNFQQTFSTVYVYIVMPMKVGNLEIPSVSIPAEGKTLKTEPLSLRVEAINGIPPSIPPQQPGQVPRAMPVQPQQQPPPTPAPEPFDPEKAFFGEIVGLDQRKFIYVGEVVPIEIRFYFDADVNARLLERPQFTGDGFTLQRFSQPAQLQQEINGRVFNVLAFKTTLTAAKSGSLAIPEASLPARVQVPNEPQGSADEFFGGVFGRMTSGLFAQTHDIEVKTKPIQLEVKPLPKTGRPDSFAGAIGQFALSASASPKKAASGDPVTLDLTVSGRGNFEAMGPPTLVGDEGWQTYPPGEKFEPSVTDPTGYNGAKRFDFTMVARSDQSATPASEFAYFDPEKEEYIILKSDPVAVEAKGGSAPLPAVAATDSSAAATPTPQPAEVAGLATDIARGTFQPIVLSQDFLIANAALGAGWLAFLAFFLVRNSSVSPRALATKAARERKRVLAGLEKNTGEPADFYHAAGELIEAHTRLAPAVFDKLAPESRLALEQVISRRDEARYSSGSFRQGLSASERETYLNALKELEKNAL